jgi:cell fate regulator YaaT (PSP1 superfamily)
MKRIAYIEIAGEPPVRCTVPDDLAVREGDECIVEDTHALECGVVSRLDSADEASAGGLPRVLRRATLQDRAQNSETALRSRMVRETCVSRAAKHNLPIRLVRVRYTFNRAVLRLVFAADDRVDCREMARELSEELRVRVDIRQVGVRDEAGTIGGLGPCGRLLCCCSWLRTFESVNVKMAKNQQLSLNPATISGLCGRLKCCLRFENEIYRDLARALPREGDMVECGEGRGVVVGRDVLRGALKVEMEDRRVIEAGAADVRPDGTRPEHRARRADDAKEDEEADE